MYQLPLFHFLLSQALKAEDFFSNNNRGGIGSILYLAEPFPPVLFIFRPSVSAKQSTAAAWGCLLGRASGLPMERWAPYHILLQLVPLNAHLPMHY